MSSTIALIGFCWARMKFQPTFKWVMRAKRFRTTDIIIHHTREFSLLGTNTFAAGYYTLSIFSIVVAPAMMEKLGAKKCLIICDCSLFLFIAANFYPSELCLKSSRQIILFYRYLLLTTFRILHFTSCHRYNAIIPMCWISEHVYVECPLC